LKESSEQSIKPIHTMRWIAEAGEAHITAGKTGLGNGRIGADINQSTARRI
jgi:hypothetical protein